MDPKLVSSSSLSNYVMSRAFAGIKLTHLLGLKWASLSSVERIEVGKNNFVEKFTKEEGG